MNIFAHQHLIQVEALLRQCDALEAQLHQTCTQGARLFDSALYCPI